MRLKGKTAFVTAAGQGIGRAIAERFIVEGAQVFASDINPALLDGLSCDVQTLDVTDKAGVGRAIDAARPDILVNCAGVVHAGTVLEVTDAQFEQCMTVNVQSMLHTIQAALPHMIERRSGAIINISSVASSIKGVRNRCIYSASKAAVIGLTKSIAADFISDGIRCNCISPGTVNSPSLQERLAESGDYEAALEAFIARQPMGRMGSAQEIAGFATYLASDEATYVSGIDGIIDGGMSL
jgi:2-keto-3-deoxy-L-fuconate dehydrogenase